MRGTLDRKIRGMPAAARNKNRLRRFIRLVLAGVVLIAGWVVYVQWTIVHESRLTVPAGSTVDTAIVLGAALWDNEPSPALKERLDQAVRLYKQRRTSTVIVSGGMDFNGSTMTESAGMKRYLIGQGIPESAILEENQARSTYENLKFSQILMQRHHFESAVIVTHSYHGARSKEMAEFIGYDHPLLSTTDSKVMWMPWHMGRETLAYTKWKLDWLLMELKLKSRLR